jgi:hypothetical protein
VLPVIVAATSLAIAIPRLPNKAAYAAFLEEDAAPTKAIIYYMSCIDNNNEVYLNKFNGFINN